MMALNQLMIVWAKCILWQDLLGIVKSNTMVCNGVTDVIATVQCVSVLLTSYSNLPYRT